MKIAKMNYIFNNEENWYEFIKPSWEKVESLIKNLDSSRYVVLIRDDKETELIRIYGNENEYMIEYLHDLGDHNVKLYPILSPHDMGLSSKMCDPIRVGKKICGKYSDAKNVIIYFYQHGELARFYDWTDDIKYGANMEKSG